jgi:N-acyl-D-amino-acid deacylase
VKNGRPVASSSPFAVPARVLVFVVVLVAGCGAPPETDPGPFDLVIRGGQVLDGTGAPAFRADLGVTGDRIVRVAREGIAEGAGTVEIDARGSWCRRGSSTSTLTWTRSSASPIPKAMYARGSPPRWAGPTEPPPSPWPYLDSAEVLGVGMNVAFLAGHNSIRREVMGLDDRAPRRTSSRP